MLQRVSIQNFKSLKDVTLDLQKVNLLIGPNNSGKTNFLKALEVFSKYAGLGYPYDKFKELHETVVFGRKNLPITFSITIRKDEIETPFEKDLRMFIMEIDSSSGLRHRELVDIEYKEDKLYKYSTETQSISLDKYLIPYLEKLRIYRPDPNQVKKSFPLLPGNEFVLSDASNLIAFFDTLRDRFPDSFNNIQRDLQYCIHEFSQIRFENVTPNDEQRKIFGDKTFKRLGLYSQNQKAVFWSDEISEGALYLISILCILHQPHPPKLLLIEEPEQGIHPRRINQVINFIFRLADQKDVQVIMTTHSPIVVDMFKDMPESIFVFDKDEEGATYIKNLQRDIIEPETEESKRLNIDPPQYLDGLGEAWTTGLLGGVPL